MRKIFLVILVVLCGCTLAEVKVEVMSERTSLENQVLGTYNSLDKEMLLLASVRGVDSDGTIRKPRVHSQEHKDAVTAMQIQAFHADDLQAFKQLRWVGENNEGLLTIFSMEKKDVPENLKDFAERYTEDEFNAVISQVNEARKIIMRRAIEMNENLTEEDLPKIRRIFGKFNAENAAAGEKIQGEDGEWTVKNFEN
ncbi:DUF1318 domain-containing protein [Desulfonema magnum]|uniref:DUF1318 n=1 Tax=Desulfonema magnum TaxID=45655 RepID=A0A975BXD3_9BACT|nr:DUF1318 domain-containing protein [Desulfonema magnum]QTA93287.1 DUF1318 [Desulfonema magnum]